MKHARIPLTLDDLRLVGHWAADCAERALPAFETASPADTRPREAIEGSRVFARGGQRTLHLRNLALAALAAARETSGRPAVSAAAQAAGYAASLAYTKALAAPHHAKHLLGPVVYTALAREHATADPSAADAELLHSVAHASPAVRDIITRWPAQKPGRSRLSRLYHSLDYALRT